jgi:hypothetical protein
VNGGGSHLHEPPGYAVGQSHHLLILFIHGAINVR